MGRKKINEDNKKIKFGISLDPQLLRRIKQDGNKVSTFIEKLIREYYVTKKM